MDGHGRAKANGLGAAARLAEGWRALDTRRTVLAIVLAYCAVHFLTRLSLSPIFTLDEAEQMLFAQELSLGYRFRHPPLITWLTWASQSVGGLSLATLSAMKYGVMAGGFCAYAFAAKGILGSWRLALLATGAFWLTYTVGYYPHLDLMHTVLLTSLLCAGLWIAVRLLRGGAGLPLYALAGAIFAAGVLAKYVFAIFAVAAVAAALSTPAARERLSGRGLVLAAGVFLLILGPYFAWALAHEYSLYGLAQTVTQREAAPGFLLFRWLKGVVALAISLAEFTLPFSVIFAALFWPALKPIALPANDGSNAVLFKTVLERMMLVGAGLMLLGVFAVGATDFKARWMHQVLIPLPAYLFLRLSLAGPLPEARLRIYALILVAVALLALTARIVSYETNRASCKNCWEYQPFKAYAAGLRDAGFEEGTIVTDSMYVGGNLRRHFPKARILVPDYPLSIFPPPASGACAAVWLGQDSTPPPPVTALLRDDLGVSQSPFPGAGSVERAIRPGKTAVFRFVILDAPDSACR